MLKCPNCNTELEGDPLDYEDGDSLICPSCKAELTFNIDDEQFEVEDNLAELVDDDDE